jgi:hypothetical protein
VKRRRRLDRGPAAFGQSREDQCHDVAGAPGGFQHDEEHALSKLAVLDVGAEDGVRHPQRKPGLADASRADQRQ